MATETPDTSAMYISVEDLQRQPDLLNQLGAKDGDVIYITEDPEGYTLQIAADDGPAQEVQDVGHNSQIASNAGEQLVGMENYQVNVNEQECTTQVINYDHIQGQSTEMEYLALSDVPGGQTQMVSILKPPEERVNQDIGGHVSRENYTISQYPNVALESGSPGNIGKTGVLAEEIIVENRPYVVKDEKYIIGQNTVVPEVVGKVNEINSDTQMHPETVLDQYFTYLAQTGEVSNVSSEIATPCATEVFGDVVHSELAKEYVFTGSELPTHVTSPNAPEVVFMSRQGASNTDVTTVASFVATQSDPATLPQPIISTPLAPCNPTIVFKSTTAASNPQTVADPTHVPIPATSILSYPTTGAVVPSGSTSVIHIQPAIETSSAKDILTPVTYNRTGSTITFKSVSSVPTTRPVPQSTPLPAPTFTPMSSFTTTKTIRPVAVQTSVPLSHGRVTSTSTLTKTAVIPSLQQKVITTASSQGQPKTAVHHNRQQRENLQRITYASRKRKLPESFDTEQSCGALIQCLSCAVTFKALPNITNTASPLCLRCEIDKRREGCLVNDFDADPSSKKKQHDIVKDKKGPFKMKSVRSFTCSKCPKKFLEKERLIAHENSHNEQELPQAVKPARSIPVSSPNPPTAYRPDKLDESQSVATIIKTESTTGTEKSIDANLKTYSNKNKHFKGKMHKCWCDRKTCFKSNVELQKHAVESHFQTLKEGLTVNCLFCGTAFQDVKALSVHLETHDPVCPICNVVFDKKTLLDSHTCHKNTDRDVMTTDVVMSNSETSDKTMVVSFPSEGSDNSEVTGFICEICGKLFCSQDFLVKHMEKHE